MNYVKISDYSLDYLKGLGEFIVEQYDNYYHAKIIGNKVTFSHFVNDKIGNYVTSWSVINAISINSIKFVKPYHHKQNNLNDKF